MLDQADPIPDASQLEVDACLAQLRQWIGSGMARELREAAGLSRLHVANELGTWPSTVARWESGERVPRGRHALEYHALLARLLQRAA